MHLDKKTFSEKTTKSQTKKNFDESKKSKKNEVSSDNNTRVSNNFGTMKGLAMVSQLGFMMVVPFIAGVFIGNFIDKHLKTSPLFLIICILLFGVSAFVNFYKIAIKSSGIDKSRGRGSKEIGYECRNKKDDN